MLHRDCMCSCYYTSRVCKFFVDGECYDNYASNSSASDCDRRYGSYLLNDGCYYRVQENCSAGEFYQQCTCYKNRSSTYSNDTCDNIGGYYTDSYCYYMEFNCYGYAVNQQCYRRVSMKKIRDRRILIKGRIVLLNISTRACPCMPCLLYTSPSPRDS